MCMDCNRESDCKLVHDPVANAKECVPVEGPVIVGAGPSGLAVAACLKAKGIPSLILERSTCVASLWQLKTYDRLRLHLPKQFCELPLMPFPAGLPTYPTKPQFVEYLEAYAENFDIRPIFNMLVVSAEYDAGFWRVIAEGPSKGERFEYICRWLVAATGENAEAVLPEINGMEEFKGPVMHTSLYRSGEAYSEKKVLVVGCGNSGMEVCLDLCNHNARPSIVVRDTVHVLPRDMLGGSTFRLSMWLLKWLPVRTVDRLLLLVARLTLGDTKQLGLVRPNLGPLEHKSLSGKTPVLDVGTLAKIKSGDVKVFPAIQRFTKHGAAFVDGRSEDFDAVLLATGYKSNVPSWLKEREIFSEKDGLQRRPFPGGWKGKNGLYAVGFSKLGLLGVSMDATRTGNDIEKFWKANDSMLYNLTHLKLAVSAVASHAAASPAQEFWDEVLPNSPMPSAIRDLLYPGKMIKSANEDTVGGVFFLAKNLHPGSKMTLHFTRTTSSATLLPRRVSDSIPFSSTQLPTILSRLSVEPNSAKAEAIKKTLSECEEPAFAGETKLCATSLESMVEFAMSSLKTRSIQAMSTKVSKEGTPKQEYTILSLRKMPDSELVACHGASYAYAVFHCHTTSASAYTASMVGMDGSKVEALAACHTDKAAGVEEAFKKFGVEPGTVPVCHFLPQDDLLWARN